VIASLALLRWRRGVPQEPPQCWGVLLEVVGFSHSWSCHSRHLAHFRAHQQRNEWMLMTIQPANSRRVTPAFAKI